MTGKSISRKNMSHIHAAAEHLHAVGANYPGRGDSAIGAKADISLSEQMQAVASAVYGANSDYCCIEDVFDTYVIIEAGDSYFRADYSKDDAGAITLAARDSWVEVEEVWQSVANSAKAGTLAFDTDSSSVMASVKALGDRTLELRVAWGWDNHREQFLQGVTDFDLENFPTPPVAYYHGYDKKNKKSPKPIYIGRTIKRENRADGHYLIAKLNNKPEANAVWEAALAQKAVVSPATASHLIRKEADGTLTYWPIVEISAWDYADSRKQAHPQSRAFPVLKALYQEAGIPLPPSIDTGTPSETPGDGVSTVVPDITPDEAAPVIATEVVRVLLERYSNKESK